MSVRHRPRTCRRLHAQRGRTGRRARHGYRAVLSTVAAGDAGCRAVWPGRHCADPGVRRILHARLRTDGLRRRAVRAVAAPAHRATHPVALLRRSLAGAIQRGRGVRRGARSRTVVSRPRRGAACAIVGRHDRRRARRHEPGTAGSAVAVRRAQPDDPGHERRCAMLCATQSYRTRRRSGAGGTPDRRRRQAARRPAPRYSTCAT